MSIVEYLPLDIAATEQARQFSSSSCAECVGLTELCPACEDLRNINNAELAHEIVDEGNLIYPKVWSTNKGEPSQHDWVSPRTKLKVPVKLQDGSIVDERYEFLEELGYNIGDRLPSNMFPTAKGFIPLLAPLEMFKYLALPKTDTICNVCHLQINKYVECPHW